jgi:putative effector of murein hydrolase LrgA (UPF0299 family)
MKLTLRDKAGISALWGTIFLFLAPITVGVIYAQGDWQGLAALALVTIGCLVSAAIGAGFFVQAVAQLTAHSQEKVRAKAAASGSDQRR